MIAVAKRLTDRLLGRGSAALTVPPLDGALKPNNRLEELPQGIPAAAPVALVLIDGKVHWAEGANLVGAGGRHRSYGAPITALAADDGRLAVALAGQGVEIDGSIPPALKGLDCVTALAFDGGQLWIAQGSARHSYADWVQDFMQQGQSGRVLCLDLASGSVKVLAQNLAFPNGLLRRPEGLIIAESWAKRLILLAMDGSRRILSDDLPGYPAGLAGATGDDFWLTLFAPRSPLLELVLREPAYRRAMMAEVPSEYWIAPALRSGQSYKEPMQGGALKQMGILKPWAPTRSYGLVVRMNAAGTPLLSLHSRAGGRRHGITSVLVQDGQVWLASTGGNEILHFASEEMQ